MAPSPVVVILVHGGESWARAVASSSLLEGVLEMFGLEFEPSRPTCHREFDLEVLDEF